MNGKILLIYVTYFNLFFKRTEHDTLNSDCLSIYPIFYGIWIFNYSSSTMIATTNGTNYFVSISAYPVQIACCQF